MQWANVDCIEVMWHCVSCVAVVRLRYVRCTPRDKDTNCHLSTATCTLKVPTSSVVCAQSVIPSMWCVDLFLFCGVHILCNLGTFCVVLCCRMVSISPDEFRWSVMIYWLVDRCQKLDIMTCLKCDSIDVQDRIILRVALLTYKTATLHQHSLLRVYSPQCCDCSYN